MRPQIFVSVLIGAAIGGCAPYAPVAPSPYDQRELGLALAGRVAGATARCLPGTRVDDRTQPVGDKILFHDGRTIWVNQTGGGCASAGRAGYTLVTELRGTSQHCSGDIVKVIDSASGMYAGSCTLGEFVPYRRP